MKSALKFALSQESMTPSLKKFGSSLLTKSKTADMEPERPKEEGWADCQEPLPTQKFPICLQAQQGERTKSFLWMKIEVAISVLDLTLQITKLKLACAVMF